MVGRTRWETDVPYSGLTPSGTLRLHRVAEWFQEAAVHASTEGGYPPSRYEEMGASWFVKDLDIVIDRPIRYGERIIVETWVSDLRRFRSHRQYRAFDRAGEIVARGSADWLFLSFDRKTRRVRPQLPDEAMKTAFPRIDDRAISEEIEIAIPDAPPTIEMSRRVRPTELDQHEHVNHTAYVAWIEDLDLPIHRVHFRFEKDARHGDEVSVRAWFERSPGVVEIRRGTERVLIGAIG